MVEGRIRAELIFLAMLPCISLCSCDSVKSALESAKSHHAARTLTPKVRQSEESFQPRRWRFLYEPGKEADFRAEKIYLMDNFWKEFKQNQSSFCSPYDNNKDQKVLVSWISEKLSAIEPSLEWEKGPFDSDREFIAISPIATPNLVPLAETMVKRSGEIDKWKITTYRPPYPAMNIVRAYKARFNENLPAYKAMLESADNNLNGVEENRGINLTIVSPEFASDNKQQDLATAMLLSEMVVGEEDTERWINHIATKQGTLTDSTKFSQESAAKDFKNEFDSLKRKIISALPDKPYWQISAPKETAIIHSKRETVAKFKGDRLRISWITPFPKLEMQLSNPEHFYSERSSKNGEIFAYLNVQADQNSPDAFDKKRDDFYKGLDTLLRNERLGAVVGDGRGINERYYFDLALANVDKAVPLIQEYCKTKNVPKTSWLRFYDECWRYEWVRMYPDTPDLKAPQEFW